MSITVQPSDVANVAPELSSETNSRINIFIGIAAGFVDENTWGTTKANQAVAVLAAHLTTLANRGAKYQGAGGPIGELKAGDIEMQFKPGARTEDLDLASTNYGEMFLALRRTIITGPIVV